MPRDGSHCATLESLMQYPLYVHRNGAPLYCGGLPDFPGADVSGNSFEELERNAQDKVQQIYDRSEHIIPVPTDDMHALQSLDMDDGKGLWVFVEIDLAQVVSQAVRIQLSMRETLLQDIDTAALARHLTRPAYIALACVHELANAKGGRARTSPLM
jgi:hypothetical protein